METLQRWKPGVDKAWLHLLAGLLWSGVGIMLMRFAVGWLAGIETQWIVLQVLGGLILACGIYFFGFSKLARKNVRRIDDCQYERSCIFAFQAWMSYPLVAVMIALGIYLRLYSPFPKWSLAVMYLGIGGSLFMASFHYYARLLSPPSAVKYFAAKGDQEES